MPYANFYPESFTFCSNKAGLLAYQRLSAFPFQRNSGIAEIDAPNWVPRQRQGLQLREQLRSYTEFPFNRIATNDPNQIRDECKQFRLHFQFENKLTFEVMMRRPHLRLFLLALLAVLMLQCNPKNKPEPPAQPSTDYTLQHATGLQLIEREGFTEVRVSTPWPNSDKTFTYAFVPKANLAAMTFAADRYDAIIGTPVERLIATSSTHIPALEALGLLPNLTGFPDTRYISSKAARQRIENGSITEVGMNGQLNTELVLNNTPDLIIGFGIDNQNKQYQTLQAAGIPVVFNGDWMEMTPLGRAEWIKFFGVLAEKQTEANALFEKIVADYQKVRELAATATERPTVLSGALFKDVWYLPAGESWGARFVADAHAEYLWKETKGSGSLSLSLEKVFERGREADFWIAPSQFTRYADMEADNTLYANFEAFQNRQVHTFANTKGETGGMLYYELAPQRPDLVLRDLVKIFHPELLPDHHPYFFTPLE